MTSHRLLRTAEVNSRRETPAISNEKLLYLGGLFGLTPSFRGGNDQPLSEAAEALRESPDYVANAGFIERELFVPEDRGPI